MSSYDLSGEGTVTIFFNMLFYFLDVFQTFIFSSVKEPPQDFNSSGSEHVDSFLSLPLVDLLLCFGSLPRFIIQFGQSCWTADFIYDYKIIWSTAEFKLDSMAASNPHLVGGKFKKKPKSSALHCCARQLEWSFSTNMMYFSVHYVKNRLSSQSQL